MHPISAGSVSRVDGRAKVTGAAKYAAEFRAPDLGYAYVVSSTITKGRISRIDTSAAARVDGVVGVLTHENRPRMADTDRGYADDVAPDGAPFRPLYDGNILFNGQPIAVVVAEAWEIARYAASLVRVEYAQDAHVTDLDRERDNAFRLSDDTFALAPAKPRGDAEKALAAADMRHDGEYYVAIEHHNPMETYASTVIWHDDGKLTVYDKTQGVQNVQRYLCGVFEMKPEDVRVVSPFVGGGFGSGLRPQYNVVLAVLAARALKRSVRVVLTRAQMYSLGYRPGSIERVALGANADGTLDAITHEAIAMTSRFEAFARKDTIWSGALYKSPNARYAHKLAPLDVNTPCDMRAPGAATGVYALECAMDELAVALKIDPLELRYRNYSDRDQNADVPFHQQGAAGMLPPRRGCLRLGAAQPRAARDARRERACRLGHGERDLGGVGQHDRRARRADRERPRRSRLRDVRYRHRHLHDHDSGRRGHAWTAARERHRAGSVIRRCRSRPWRADHGSHPRSRMRSLPRVSRCVPNCCVWRRRCRVRRLRIPGPRTSCW